MSGVDCVRSRGKMSYTAQGRASLPCSLNGLIFNELIFNFVGKAIKLGEAVPNLDVMYQPK